jgi:hypothetical protein
MTGEQATWLRKNAPYRALSNAPSGMRWTKKGMLHADGKFDLQPPRGRAPVRAGSFEVGVLEPIQTGANR